AVELLPGEPDPVSLGDQSGTFGAVFCADSYGRRKAGAAIGRTRIKHALARLAVGEPRHVIDAVGNRQGRPLMRANVRLPVINADPPHRPRSGRIGEGHDGMVARGAVEDVAKRDHRPVRAGKTDTEPTAFARLVLRDPRRRDACTAILGPGKGKRGARIALSLAPRCRRVALVDPSD